LIRIRTFFFCGKEEGRCQECEAGIQVGFGAGERKGEGGVAEKIEDT